MHLQDSLRPVKPSLGLRQRPRSQGKYSKLGRGRGVPDHCQSRGALGQKARNAGRHSGNALKPRR